MCCISAPRTKKFIEENIDQVVAFADREHFSIKEIFLKAEDYELMPNKLFKTCCGDIKISPIKDTKND